MTAINSGSNNRQRRHIEIGGAGGTISAKFICAFFALLLLLFGVAATAAQTATNGNATDGVFVLNAEKLHSNWDGNISDAGWRYKSGDDAAWAVKDFDDRDWQSLRNTIFYIENLPAENWTGAGWFRLHVAVDEPFAREPLAIRLWHWGATEIYLDGKLLHNFGKVASKNNSGEVEQNPHGFPVPLVFETGGEHVIAVRYSFSAEQNLSTGVGLWLAHGRFNPGFNSQIQTGNGAIRNYSDTLRAVSSYKLFVGVLYSLALLHFLLFAFYRRERTHLFYSLFAFSLANATFSNNVYNNASQTVLPAAIAFIIFAFSYGIAFIALQAFLYEAFAERFSKFFYFAASLLAAQLAIVLFFLRDRTSFYATCVLLIISLADSLRLVFSAVWQKRDGAWIIASGVIVLAVGIFMSIAFETKILDNTQLFSDINDITLYFGLPVAVSIFLARNFARTNRRLEEQLVQVKELSEKELAQSRLNAELALEREQEKARFALVAAENERQAKELEEARQLQLSMLPKKLPQIANLEIAAYMKPATEVGGDYYDFHVAEDGTLTVAVGDATGHGLKAGTIVTATKSLFNNLAHESDIGQIFKQSSHALKAMKLRGMFMAMTMLKIRENSAFIAMAGMPSVLIYRAAIKQVEEIAIRQMPLGSFSKSAYIQQELRLAAGDSVILMSDGFPEMFNEAGEMLEAATAQNLLAEVADQSAEEIINRFVETGENWAGTRPPDDDVTFVVLKVKADG